MKCLPLDLGLDFQTEQQHHFEESADEDVASKCPGNNCEHQLEDIKTPPGIVTKKSKISGGGISRGLGVYDRQDREIGLAKGLLGHRLEGYDVRRLSGTLFFEWVLGTVLCPASFGQSSWQGPRLDLGFWL